MEQFINAIIGKRIQVSDQGYVTCSKTYTNHHCTRCSFAFKGSHCPQGKVYPACFASERTDRESVYFPIPQILVKP